MDWSKLPDLVAVGLLAWAFASVARQSSTTVSANWLIGWLLIVFHFFAFMLAPLPGATGTLFNFLGVLTLVWAGLLFARASVPYRRERSSMAMMVALLGSHTVYLSLLLAPGGAPRWALNISAVVLGFAPLAVALATLSRSKHFLRWATVILHCGLSGVLLAVQNRGDGGDAALNAVLFTVYVVAATHFWYMYRRTTAGAIITLVGFVLWANVFTVAPALAAWFPQVHMESEVWNLPKYVVAVGMILVLLEDQRAHNRYLALHDELTGLPNRRLFHDRLSSALERARRTGMQTALLMLDLDDFKQVNDTMGHHMGDLLLQEVARLFSGRIRRSDTVARTGGDEFAVILEGPTNRAEASHVARSLLNLLVQPFELEGRQASVSASLGLAIFPEDGQDMEALCIQADLRMYDHKRASGGHTAIGPALVPVEVPDSSRQESETARYSL